MIYNLDINDRAFKAIKEKRKKVEIRVTKQNGFDYSNIKSSDIIKFNNTLNEELLCRVIKNNWYTSIEELLTVEGTKYTLSSTDDFEEGVRSIKSFNGYEAGMKLNAVHAIHVEPTKLLLRDLECMCSNIDAREYTKYQQLIKSSMEYPDWLGDFNVYVINELLNTGSKIWIYYFNKEFVCSMMFIPADIDGLIKLGLDNYEYSTMADYGPMMVNPKYRGNNLQYQMLLELDKYSKDNNYLYASSTIHPDNIYSINNFIKDEFEYLHTKKLKRGVRNVYLRKF